MNEKQLNQHCLPCGAVGVRYVKTKGGFHKLCDACREILDKAGLVIQADRVFAMNRNENWLKRMAQAENEQPINIGPLDPTLEIVSSADCSVVEIAFARAENRFLVDDDGLGFVLRRK